MDAKMSLPGELDGEAIAILVLFHFHCRVQQTDDAQPCRKRLLLWLMDKVYGEQPSSPSFQVFADELKIALASEDDGQAQIVFDYLANMLSFVDIPDGLTKLFDEKFSMILPNYEQMGVLNTSDIFFERRSFFGLYFRRARLVFDSLDLQARNELTKSTRTWREGDFDRLDRATSSPGWQHDARLSAFRQYQLGLLRGDYTQAKDNMEKLFDFFAPGADHELHQYTLLHLAAFHLQSGSHPAARTVLQEAISLARSANDHECILACESLMNRILGVGSSLFSSSDRMQRHMGPPKTVRDASWQAQQDRHRGRPLTTIVHDLDNAVQLTESTPHGMPSLQISLELMDDAKRRDGNATAETAVELAQMWSSSGQGALAAVYRQVSCGQDTNSNSVLDSHIDARTMGQCQEAWKLAEQGRYQQALCLLISPQTYKAHSFNEHQEWVTTMADVLWLRARRRGEHQTLRILSEKLPSRKQRSVDIDVEEAVEAPTALVNLALQHLESNARGSVNAALDEFANSFKYPSELSTEERIESLLVKARNRLDGQQPMLALLPALSALSEAKRLDYGHLARTSTVLLAETLGLHLLLPRRALTLLEREVGSCLVGQDVELRAQARWTYARLLLACSTSKTDEELHRVLQWMTAAEQGEFCD
ncbi:hypothetical protein BCV70DRAFT_197146 [Testicularia cyperi]|uniref:Anaphase-promoting complex subunit 5 n=1 Tax=Testicularia cyperi TaxID=1882483 RepID=A0A317XY86_9BASI|nr:hypothetical protein BCV70DRAFT_197146 [Testicularia cyperi]